MIPALGLVWKKSRAKAALRPAFSFFFQVAAQAFADYFQPMRSQLEKYKKEPGPGLAKPRFLEFAQMEHRMLDRPLKLILDQLPSELSLIHK